MRGLCFLCSFSWTFGSGFTVPHERQYNTLLAIDKKIIGDPFEAALRASKGRPELHKAVHSNDIEAILKCLDTCEDIDVEDMNGRSALHDALDLARVEIVQALLKAGASATKPDADGKLPLAIAAHSGNIELASMLLDHGAPIEKAFLRGPIGMPLSIARSQGHDDFIHFLRDRGATFPEETLEDASSLFYHNDSSK